MIPANQLISVFRNIIGWPYATPGSNNSNGIDCSGAFVYAYQQFGERIYHGSNRIIREYCRDVQTVTSLAQLVPGMAIFKSRTNLSNMKAEYKPGGRYYDPALPYDYYHVGLVASVYPLEIINATAPVARIDNRLPLWCCAGYLTQVDYDQPALCTCPCPCGGPEAAPVPATVIAPSGNTVNLRAQPSKDAVILVRVPLGAMVSTWPADDPAWRRVRYQSTEGFMMSEFLLPG